MVSRRPEDLRPKLRAISRQLKLIEFLLELLTHEALEMKQSKDLMRILRSHLRRLLKEITMLRAQCSQNCERLELQLYLKRVQEDLEKLDEIELDLEISEAILADDESY